jgi:hypothetical protein
VRLDGLVFEQEKPALASDCEIEISVSINVPDCNLDAATDAAAVIDHVFGPVYIVGSRVKYPLVPVDPQRPLCAM